MIPEYLHPQHCKPRDPVFQPNWRYRKQLSGTIADTLSVQTLRGTLVTTARRIDPPVVAAVGRLLCCGRSFFCSSLVFLGTRWRCRKYMVRLIHARTTGHTAARRCEKCMEKGGVL